MDACFSRNGTLKSDLILWSYEKQLRKGHFIGMHIFRGIGKQHRSLTIYPLDRDPSMNTLEFHKP